MSFSSRTSKGFLLSGASLLLGVCLVAAPLPRQSQDNSQQPAPDNSKTNKRDRDNASPTADQQKMSPADRELTRKIRAALHQDKSLSTYAHNIKIVIRDSRVRLRGPVRSEEEKTAIESKATEIAGAGNVTNELEVAPPKS
jgi:hyperosmotically inducible periplasmic protein